MEVLVKKLIYGGYNIIPVQDKRPVGLDKYEDLYDEWNPERCVLAIESAKKATGYALLGRINPKYPEKILIIIDEDSPGTVDAKLAEAGVQLPQTWTWRTGPRCPICMLDGVDPKHGIKCASSECTCERGHKFPLVLGNRGRARAFLIDASLAPREGVLKLLPVPSLGYAVEIRIRGYQLIPPSLHPSGARYEWEVSPEALAEPAELDSETWRRFLEALGYKGEKKREGDVGEVGGLGVRHCEQLRVLTDAQIDEILNIIKSIYVPGHRDYVLFATLSLMWRVCVDAESAKRFVERLSEWAERQYSDENRRKNLDTWRWVFTATGEKRRWGRKRFTEVAASVMQSVEKIGEFEARAKALDLLHQILQVMGVKPKRALLITYDFRFDRENAIKYIANDPTWGLAYMVKRLPGEKKLVALARQEAARQCAAEGECDRRRISEIAESLLADQKWVEDAQRRLTTYGYKLITSGWYVSRVARYIDATTGMAYYNVKLCHRKRRHCKKLRWVSELDVGRAIRHITSSIYAEEELARIIDAIATEMTGGREMERYVTSGVVHEDGQVKLVARGPMARHFRQLVKAEGDPKAFLEFMKLFYGDSSKAWLAYTLGMFQAFNFLRKQFHLRNLLLILAGEPQTGKSEIARTVIKYIYGMEKNEKSAAVLYQPTRIGRAVMNTTLPLAVQEAKTFATSPNVADTIKNIATELTAWEVATAGTRTVAFPAYSGLIITAQTVRITDPGVAARVYLIQFSRSEVIPPERVRDFQRWREARARDLLAFGRLYLETAVREWDAVKDIILQGDYIKAAVEYMRYIVGKLGGSVPEVDPQEHQQAEEQYVDEVEALVELIAQEAKRHCSAEKMLRDCVAELLLRDMFIDIGVKCLECTQQLDGEVIITSLTLHKLRESTNLKNLAEKLNERFGESGCVAEYKRNKKTRYVGVPMHCFVRLFEPD